MSTDVWYPLNEDIELDKGETMFNKGIDIYDGNSDYFNNICSSYIREGSNVMKERREKNFVVAKLCERNCKYSGIDYNRKKVRCICDTKGDVNITKDNDNNVRDINVFNDKIYRTNFLIVKCYKVIFYKRNIIKNIGFWMYLSFMLFHSGFVLIFHLVDVSNIMSHLNFASSKANPSAISNVSINIFYQKDQLNKNYFDEEKYKEEVTSTEDKEATAHQIIYDVFVKFPYNIDHFPYWLASQKDERSFIQIAWDNYKESHLLLSPFFARSIFISIGINFSFFILFLSLIFSINSLFYSDEVISANYSKTLLEASISNIPNCIISGVITVVIMRLLKHFRFFPRSIGTLLSDLTDIVTLYKYIRQILLQTRKRITFYFLFTFIFTSFFWYYLTIFVIIFSKIKLNWFISSCISILFISLVDILYCLLISLTRVLSLKTKSRRLYNISLFLKQLY